MQPLKQLLFVPLIAVLAVGGAVAVRHRRFESLRPPREVALVVPKPTVKDLIQDAKKALVTQSVLALARDPSALPPGASREYEISIENYLNQPFSAVRSGQEDEELSHIIQNLKQSLSGQGISMSAQAQIIHGLGRHYFNRSVIGKRENVSRPVRIRYLKLAIAHLQREY